MKKVIKNPQSLVKPLGYAYLSTAAGAKKLIFIAGQLPLDRKGKVVGKGNVALQAQKVFENLGVALKAAGAGIENVLKIGVFLIDMNDLAAVREVRLKFFGKNNPPSTTVQISRLANPDALIEIEAYAAI